MYVCMHLLHIYIDVYISTYKCIYTKYILFSDVFYEEHPNQNGKLRYESETLYERRKLGVRTYLDIDITVKTPNMSYFLIFCG